MALSRSRIKSIALSALQDSDALDEEEAEQLAITIAEKIVDADTDAYDDDEPVAPEADGDDED